jgi:signal transduction histidine kinase
VLVVRAHALSQELNANLEVRTHQLESDLRPALLSLDVGDALAADARAASAAVLVRQIPGPIVFRSSSFPALRWDSERALATSARESADPVTVSDREGRTFRVESVIIERQGADRLALQVAASTAENQRALEALVGVMGVAILLVLAVASYGSGFTARRALAPVDEIVARARAIEADRLGERLDVRAGSEELDRLVSTLNGMLDRIDTSMRSARRFAADASHELQTPLTAMRNVVDLCVRRARSPEDYHEMALGILAEVDRLSALIKDLRLLALADAGHLLDLGRPDRALNVIGHPHFRSPLLWDVSSITVYLTCSTIYLFLPLIPDIALLRDARASGGIASISVWRSAGRAPTGSGSCSSGRLA